MKILYGVNGEGMGHATRSEVVIGSLLDRHDVSVMASGAAFRYLGERLRGVEEVFGPSFALKDGQIRRWQTVDQFVRSARKELPERMRVWAEQVHAWRPEVVITDFEPLSASFARRRRTPLISVDNIHMIDRCVHGRGIIAGVARTT